MTEFGGVNLVEAVRDRDLNARVVRQVPLMYRAGADVPTDRPAHVRAGSGLAWAGEQLALVQDDANFLALIDTDSGKCDAIVLPAGTDGVRQFDDARGNKAFKYDFESLIALSFGNTNGLVGFGSGSSTRREHVLLVRDANLARSDVRIIPAPQFYAELRACAEFSGSELNVEGAAVVGESIRLFGRGNGAPRDGLQPINATCDVSCASLLAYLENPAHFEPPRPHNVVQYLLGNVAGVRLSFTDAVTVGTQVIYSAAAEASPNVVLDGVVEGSAIGVIDSAGGATSARWTSVTWPHGEVARVKVEGVALGQKAGQLFVVVDRDEHDQPSELLELEISGFPGN